MRRPELGDQVGVPQSIGLSLCLPNAILYSIAMASGTIPYYLHNIISIDP